MLYKTLIYELFFWQTQTVEEARVQSMVQKNDDVEIEQNEEHSDAFGVWFWFDNNFKCLY